MTNKNIKLRAIEPEDLDFLYDIENDIAIWDIGTTNVPYSRLAITKFLADTHNDIYIDQQLRLIVEENSTHKPIGTIDLTNFSPRHLRAETGIVICKDYRNKGLGKETLKTLLDYCRNTLFLNQIYAIVDINNKASLKLFTSAGFSQTATLRNWLYNGKNYVDAILFQFFFKKN